MCMKMYYIIENTLQSNAVKMDFSANLDDWLCTWKVGLIIGKSNTHPN